MNAVKKMIPLRIKKCFHEQRQNILDKRQIHRFENYLRNIKKQKKKIFLIDAADYGNLGDQAIYMAELQYLKDNFSDYHIIDVGFGKFDNFVKIVEKYVGSKDIITLQGGGNFGNEYKRAENTRRKIIQSFPNNKIILFPQTMYFTADEDGERELLKSQAIYSKHVDLTLIAREKTSYNLMKKHFSKNTVLLTPDIVLYLNKSLSEEVRSGVLFCCRNDIEGILQENDKKRILNDLEKRFSKVTITDTIGENNFNSVESKFTKFRQAQLVVTDRLHGMVFAAITGTPCIALSNYNYKVRGTYEWIKHLNYIKFVDSIDEIPIHLESLLKVSNTHYDNEFALPYYELIIKEIRAKDDLRKGKDL
jgi:pyruvyl transferase EpsI